MKKTMFIPICVVAAILLMMSVSAQTLPEETVFVTNENSNTFDLEIFEHDGTTFTLITTVSLVAPRRATFSIAVCL